MKFIASKKLSDNSMMSSIISVMLFSLILAMVLSMAAKGIDYGVTPMEWSATVLGNEAEFIDPMSFNDLLLGIHTDLFGLIITFILIASVYARMGRSRVMMISFLTLSLLSLLAYPIGMLFSPLIGSAGVILSLSAFILFHSLMIMGGLDSLIGLLRKKF
ncbi:MAG: hypothetical protein Q8R58_08565 [Sulfuricurvum sp.]|nr:hypothetical protein [Sulfuricurvum sp.]